MRISFLVAAIGPALTYQAYGGGAPKACYRVEVEITNQAKIPLGLLEDSEQSATKIFSGIGIQLTWADELKRAYPPAACIHSLATQYIAVEIIPHAPASFSSAALAMAMPGAVSSVRIAVFYDRVEPLLAGHHASQATIFGYVLAHEIGHVLQGVARHSDVGVMRSRWLDNDFKQMSIGALAFTNEDVRLIRRGFESVNWPGCCSHLIWIPTLE
jgi:hypothetical protein